MSRVTTLKKKERVQEIYHFWGIHGLLEEIKFNLKDGERPEKTIKRFKLNAGKQLMKMWREQGEHQHHFLKTLCSGSRILELTPLTESVEDYDYLKKLIPVCMEKKTRAQAREGELYEILYKRGDIGEFKGYGAELGSMSEKGHGLKWQLKSGGKLVVIYDVARLFGEVLFQNAIEKFVELNEQYIHYELFRQYVEKAKDRTTVEIPNDSWLLDIYQSLNEQYEVTEKRIVMKEGDKNYFKGKEQPIPYSVLHYVVAPMFFNKIGKLKEKIKKEQKDRLEYATACVTKKNIPKEVEKIMKQNAILKKYGYVELDEDTDLELFEQLEVEFVRINEEYPWLIPHADDYSFRVRRLGKHKASGLHYGFAKSTVIDIDSPKSYVHELFHQIDYTKYEGELLVSESLKFKRVVDLYCSEMARKIADLPDDNEFRISWEGKNKYNSQYFLSDTEIFARCGEWYMKWIGLETSFLPEVFPQYVYPESEELKSEIKTFFNSFFKVKREESISA